MYSTAQSLSSCVVTTKERHSRPQQEITEATRNNSGSRKLHVEAIAGAGVTLYAPRMQASIIVMHYDAIIIDHRTSGRPPQHK